MKREMEEETESGVNPLTKKEKEREKEKKEKENLLKELQEKNELAEKYFSMLQRLQAEFENYKKRAERERLDYIEQANAGLILKLLPVLDNFERALNTESENVDSFREGVAMIFSQLQTILGMEGLSPIHAVGEEFDPYYHEAVLTACGEYEDDTVIEEVEKGYLFKNRVLRPSKVKVGKRGE